MDMVKPAGFAMSKLVHFAPEVGYYLSPDLMVSLQLRFQLISGGDRRSTSGPVMRQRRDLFAGQLCASPDSARGDYFFGEGDLRTYVAGIAGVGDDPPRGDASSRSHSICGGMTMGNRPASTPSRRGRSSWAAARASCTT